MLTKGPWQKVIVGQGHKNTNGSVMFWKKILIETRECAFLNENENGMIPSETERMKS